MIALVATLRVDPEKTEDFEAKFAELARQVQAHEPGCLIYQLTRSRTEAGVYKVLEMYKNQSAVDLHMGTEYFRAANKGLAPCMAGPASLEYLDAVI